MKRRTLFRVGGGAILVAVILGLVFDPGTLLKISIAEVFLMVIPATGFPIVYTLFFRWWETPLGRALFTKALGLGLLVDVSAIYAVWGDDYPLREHVRFIVFTLILTGLWYQFSVIIKIKLAAKKRERMGLDRVPMS